MDEERQDIWYRCAVEILAYLDIDGGEYDLAKIIEEYFPDCEEDNEDIS